jgi:glycosyltransferase involved in cell wall biosynthesis
MKLSVLIAAYHAGPTIARAIASVQAQTHRDWELVVVEDGSHDDTEAIVRRRAAGDAHGFRYENLGRNQGVAAARNRLLQLATGEAVAFLDADDFWSPDHLTAGVRQLTAGAGLVATGVTTFDLQTGAKLEDIRPPAALLSAPVLTLFAASVIVTSSSVLLARALIAQTGEFDPALRVGEDRDYWLRAALAGGRFGVTPGVTCHYAKHAGSAMGGTLLVAAQDVLFYEKHFHLAAVPAGERRRRLARSLANAARLVRATDARASARQLWRAWRLTPWDFALLPQLVLSRGRTFVRP